MEGKKYQNYYILEHSGNIPSSFYHDIVWHWTIKDDLLEISILFSGVAFTEIFYSIFFLYGNAPSSQESYEEIADRHVKYYFILLSMKKFRMQPKI